MTPPIHRRDLLKLGVAGTLAPWAGLQAWAQTAPLQDYRALVCVFLFGGNDGNNLLVPTDSSRYAQYQRARPNLALPREQLLPLSLSNTAGATYGLHPAMGGVQGLVNSGAAAVMANVGPLMVPTSLQAWQQRSVPLPANLFSHTDQQNAWQSAISQGAARHGWGGRLLERLVPPDSLNRGYCAVSLAGGNLWELGDAGLSAYRVSPSGEFGFDFYDPQNLSDPVSVAISGMLAEQPADPFGQTWLSTLTRSIDNQRVLTGALAGANLSTAFPETGLGVQLRMAARLISARSSLGLKRQCFFCSIGGFDTHGEDQLGTQNAAFAEISDAVTAFHAATLELGLEREVTLFTASDFGRNLPSNGAGTDHGWGSHHLVVGGSVQGGRLVGQFPELLVGGPDDAGSGVWIPTTAIDQVGSELGQWFGASPTQLDAIFPRRGEFNPSIGLMRSA